MSSSNEINLFNPDSPIDQIKQHFVKDGYCIFINIISNDQLQRINRQLTDHFSPFAEQALKFARGREDRKKFKCDVIPWDPITEGNKTFLELERHPVVTN